MSSEDGKRMEVPCVGETGNNRDLYDDLTNNIPDCKAVIESNGLSTQLYSPSEGGIALSCIELKSVGCSSCILRFSGQCPHGLKDDDDPSRSQVPQAKQGFCNELASFILSLAKEGDSESAVWEKYHIFKSRLQESSDYADYKKHCSMISKAEEELGYDDPESKRMIEMLKMDRNAAKMWWNRLNQQVIQSLQKVVDREQKKNENSKLPGILQANTINFNIEKK